MTAEAEIAAHVGRTIGPIGMTFGEVLTDDLNLKIHHVKSSLFRRHEVVVTSGMSSYAMNVPPEENAPAYAEMVCVLPKGWPLSHEALQDEKNYWPVRLLKTVARDIRQANSWIGYGHTVANGTEEGKMEPYAGNTGFCAALVMPPLSLGEAAWVMKRKDGQEVFFWTVVPLYREELAFKIENGVDALLDLFDRKKVTDRIDISRPCAA